MIKLKRKKKTLKDIKDTLKRNEYFADEMSRLYGVKKEIIDSIKWSK